MFTWRIAVVAFTFTLLSVAQDRGTIQGFVTDPSGAAVPGVTVTVTNVATGLTQTANTGADGSYSLLYLPSGTYTVAATSTGFNKAEISGVVVQVATVSTVDIQLAVGAVEQTVEVTAAAPLLDVQGTNLGKVIPTQAIHDLPLFISGGLRSNLAFVILTPGVIGPGEQSAHRRRAPGRPERTTGRRRVPERAPQ